MEGNGLFHAGTQDERYFEMVRSTHLINQVVQQMKEIPVLPSEDISTSDSNALKRVEFPKEGGILTYMAGFDQPYQGFPYFEFVDKIDLIKKIGRATVSGSYHYLNKRKWLWPTLIPAFWLIRGFLAVGVSVFYRVVERFKIKHERHCQAIRELHRAFCLKSDELRDNLGHLVRMVLEFDNAYRFRLQDILPELNKDALKHHPRRELIRLLELVQSREKKQEVSDTWKLCIWLVKYYLLLDRSLLRMIQDVLTNVDLNLIQLTERDKPFCVRRVDYTFGFMLNPTLEDRLLIADAELATKHTEVRKTLDQHLLAEVNTLKEKQILEQKMLNSTPERKKQIEEYLAVEQKKLEQEYAKKSEELVRNSLTAEESVMLKRHAEELKTLGEQHDSRRAELGKLYNK